ncbi:Clr5 domain-containing protein [Fusarium austroafricanum]|uniref:Clr5 domain-containing protein n=1 Tax=Fusarium austroafricanum TaxID=2364996 RepID=A0A8H4NYL7_9HYPO|nr:Clr5 domain-containing protein [Fusarium austroafricanum]
MSGAAAYPTSGIDWENHRDAIIRLYIAEDRTLSEVRQIMENKFSFKATLQRWGAMKNYKAKEKDMMVERVCEALANGENLDCLVFRGHSIKHHRVLRHWRAKTQLGQTATDHPRDALDSHGMRGPLRGVGGASSGEIILLSAKTLVQNFASACGLNNDTTAQPFLSRASSGSVSNIQTNQFWHDCETAIYLLRIGSTALGWRTLHTCWETAAENLLSQPITLLQKVLTTLHPYGSLRRFPEVSDSTLRFIANLVEIKFGISHPLVHICRHIRQDNEGPRTAESTLTLMSSLFEEDLGQLHHETFQTNIALINRYTQNGDITAAELTARRLVDITESSPQRSTQLPKALRKLAHVLKIQGRYGEAILFQQRILSDRKMFIPEDLRIYTKEDIAELQRLQGNLYMESESLLEALLSAQRFFGPNQAPSLHIWDKLKASLFSQGRDLESVQGNRMLGHGL